MKTIAFHFFLFLAFLTGTALIGCKDSPTESKQQPAPGTLLLNKLSVAIIPGGTETVTIIATDPNNLKDIYSVNCDKPEIANVSLSDSLLTITGLNYGTANVTVTSQKDLSRTLPVQVYNHKVLDTGELLIAFVDTFEYRGHYTSYSLTGSFWHPVTSNGFQALGSLCLNYYNNPDGKEVIMVVKAKEGSNALAHPVSYSKVYSGGFGGAWIPVPPVGYVALGTVVVYSFGAPPSLSDVVCVREDLTIPGEPGSFIWKIRGSNGNFFISWKIDSPDAGALELAYLGTGTFVSLGDIYGNLSNNPPSVHPVMNVLKVTLPLLSEAPSQTFQPKIEGFDTPPAQTVPLLSRAMLMPHTIVKDPNYPGNPNLRVRNSPMYRLEREVFYKLLYHNYNQTSQVQTNNVTIRSGITTTESNRYWTETAVSISFEAGISIKIFELKITTTVSKSFGYEQQNSISVLQEKEVSTSVNTAPGKAAALWQKYNRFVLKRHNGTQLETVDICEFGIDSYVTDEYPN